MKIIDHNEALALLDKAIALRGPEHQAGECVYVDAGQPVCLVGTALVEAGVPLLALERMDRQQGFNGAEIYKPAVLDILESDGEVLLTREALTLFQAAQSHQDGGADWGTARALAVSDLKEVAFE